MNSAYMDSYVKHATRKHLKRALDDAYWKGAALGMLAGASLGIFVGLVY